MSESSKQAVHSYISRLKQLLSDLAAKAKAFQVHAMLMKLKK